MVVAAVEVAFGFDADIVAAVDIVVEICDYVVEAAAEVESLDASSVGGHDNCLKSLDCEHVDLLAAENMKILSFV